MFERMDTFEHELLTAVRKRHEGETPLRAFGRFILDRSDTAMAGDGRRRVAELSRLVTDSPSLLARERQIVAKYTDALTALLAGETGADPDDIEPRLAAEAMMAFHRSLVDFARRRSLSGSAAATSQRKSARRVNAPSSFSSASSPITQVGKDSREVVLGLFWVLMWWV